MLDNDRIRIGLMGASFETGNMGVGALAAGAIRCIYNQWPNAEVYILDYAKKPSARRLLLGGNEVQVGLLNIRFSKKLYLANNIALLLLVALIIKLIPSHRARTWLVSRNTTLREISRSEMMASLAGGDSFSDIYGLRRFLYVSLPQILVVMLGKKLILLPQTFGPFRGRVSRVLGRFIVRNAASIYARDRRSLLEIDRLLGHKNSGPRAEFRHDVGFALEPVTPREIKVDKSFDVTSRPLVGLNISGLLYMGGYDRKNMFGLRGDYGELVRRIIELLITAKGASVLLVPHVFGNEQNSESDAVACSAVYSVFGETYSDRLGLLRGDYDQGEIKYMIGMCEFFIGSRMHACIAAISQCVPTVAVAYSDKFIGVMETIGSQSLVADARKLNLDELLALIESVYDTRYAVRRELEQSMPQVVRTAIQVFSEMGEDGARRVNRPGSDLRVCAPEGQHT